jgi:hypothetical protein
MASVAVPCSHLGMRRENGFNFSELGEEREK